jgi:putative ABC transport system permease protein
MSPDLRARDAFIWVNDVRRDLAYGARALARTRGFTAVAMITLALGIGAVTVVYSVLRNVVLDPFPYSRSERLVNVLLKDANGRIIRGPYFAAPEYLDYQEQTQAFEDVVATSRQGVHWSREGGTEALVVAWMTPNGFDFLGVTPLIGRAFDNGDAAPGAPPVGVMSYRTWMTHFGGDAGVLGRTMLINGEARTVIGVMPPRFEWNIADLWLPAALSRTDDPASPRGFRAFQAHLRPGVTPREAEAQLNVIGKRRAAQYPGDYPDGFRFEVIAVVDWVVRDFRAVLYTLFGAVSLLLVIACCNVANMLLARATAREREMAIRTAPGASRGRIVRQLLVESALLAAGGLVLGAAFAYGGIAALARYMPRQGVPWETQIRLDLAVLLFALVAAAVATIGVGLYPALQSVRQGLGAAGIGSRTTAGPRQTRMRSGLVVAQVALSIVLVLGAGVLMRTFVKLVNADFGFDPRQLLVAGTSFPPRQTPEPGDTSRFYRETLERLRTIPEVRSAAIGNYPPPFGGMSSPVVIGGASVPPQATVSISFSSEGLTETLGLRVVRGRYLSQLDVERAHRVAVVNEALVQRFFGDQDPLGGTLQLTRLSTLPRPIADPTFTIIGVLGNTANQGPRDAPRPQVFVPFTIHDVAGLAFVLRTTSDPLRVLGLVRQHAKAIRADVAIVEPSRLEDLIQQAFYARPRFVLLVLGIFAATGLILVAFGIYGVLAYMVSQQTREIAIRIALGSERRDVMRMVLRFGLQLVAAGLVLGLAASLVTNRLLSTQLWNISAHDPATFATVAGVIVIIAMIACWIPARRAVRVEPTVALRHE